MLTCLPRPTSQQSNLIECKVCFGRCCRKSPGHPADTQQSAAVVGLLGAALYNPLWTSSVKMPADFAIAPVGFGLLTVWRAPPLVVVAVGALGGIALAHGMS